MPAEERRLLTENTPVLPQAPPTVAEEISQFKEKANLLMPMVQWTPIDAQQFYNAFVLENPNLEAVSDEAQKILANHAALVVFFRSHTLLDVWNQFLTKEIIIGITKEGGGLNLAHCYGSMELLSLVSRDQITRITTDSVVIIACQGHSLSR